VNAVVCACGRRAEIDGPWTSLGFGALRTPSHDPDECSRQIGYQGRLDGRAEMVEPTIKHLLERRSLSGLEIAEIRTNLLDLVHSLPLGPVR
jgi:hypothetical protein